MQEFENTVGTHIRFSENGIDLGKTNSPFHATLSNEKLAFKQDEEEVAYISNNKMHITNAEILDTLRIGEEQQGFFTWIQGVNGNLSLNIENFNNNREQDVKEVVEEIAFYLKRKNIAVGGV